MTLNGAWGWTLFGAVRALAWSRMAWVVGGGLFYTAGMVSYIFGERVRHFYGIWHLFVIAGSAAHYIAIVAFVA